MSFNYSAKLRKRIASSLYIYIILGCVEILVGILTSQANIRLLQVNTYGQVAGLISVRIVSYIVVLLLDNFLHVRKRVVIPGVYWICILFIPASSPYMFLVVLNVDGIAFQDILLSLIFLMGINVTAFYLYDATIESFQGRMEKLLLHEQNRNYWNQLKAMDQSFLATHAVRHDLKNHLAVLEITVKSGNYERALEYIGAANKSIEPLSYSVSGNLVIDSILNFKLYEAQQRHVKVGLHVTVPTELHIKSFDLTCILGNLLDNAIEAAEKESDGKVEISIEYNRERLLFYLKNTYSGDVKITGEGLETSKKDKENHGIGLRSVKNVIEKYDGTLVQDMKENWFTTLTILNDRIPVR